MFRKIARRNSASLAHTTPLERSQGESFGTGLDFAPRPSHSQAFITDIEIPMLLPDERLITRLGLPGRPLRGVSAVPAGPTCLTAAGRRFDMGDLARK